MAHRMSIRPSTTSDHGSVGVHPDSFKARLSQLADETLQSLQAIWIQAGYEEVECQGLLGDLLHKIKVTCATELAAEQQILEHAKIEVSSKLEQLNDYLNKLGRGQRFEQSFGGNYADKLSNLEAEVTSLEAEVSERQAILDKDYANIENFLNALGEPVPPLETFKGPEGTPHLSDVRLKLLREYSATIAPLKGQRIEDMQNIARECKEYMDDMEIAIEGWETLGDEEDEPANAKCNNALLEFARTGTLNMAIHKDALESLRNRCASLLEEKMRRRDELSRTGAEIARLWTLLRIPSSEREAFQSSFQMNLSMATLAKGHDELERLYTVRATSLKKVVSSIRTDILALWDEACITSDAQRCSEFPLYFQSLEALEDSAVETHEEYFNALRARVEELRPLLAKIARRETVVNERVELEHLQMNPERLNSRGPNAREERKREEGMTVRVKNLEKLTREVMAMIQSYEDAHGTFLYAGERYCERIAQQEDTYTEIRDALRNSRKKGKDAKPDPVVPASKTVAAMKRPGTTGTQSLTAKLGSMSVDLGSSSGSSMLHLQDENNDRDRNSVSSNGTECTSATEIRDRQSSATVVKGYNPH